MAPGRALRIVALWLWAYSGVAMAEEGGAGHYFPGSYSSFIDGVPAAPVKLLRLTAINYSGSVDANVTVPIAGLAAVDVDVESSAVALTGLWRPDIDLGERWSYAAAITIPWVDLTVEADVAVPAISQSRSVRRSASDSGLGDALAFPVMVNYKASPSLSYNARLGVYIPTGDYELGRLANTGKNYWTFEPTVALMYLSPDNGRELSAFFGMTFNTENNDTNYKTGTQAHLDITAAQHFPLWGGLAGVGASAYWYEQLSGDSGEGAVYGDFKGQVRGLGPVLSFSRRLGGHSFTAELKWIQESGARLRPEGDSVFLKAVYSF